MVKSHEDVNVTAGYCRIFGKNQQELFFFKKEAKNF